MTIERLRTACQVRPFQPFTISMADGREFYVPSPEFLFIPPKAERTFIYAHGEETFHIIDLLLVSSLDFQNGRPARRRRR